MNYSVVTTFNAQGYEQYGQKMIQTFLANWPAEVELIVYAENCNVIESAENLKVFDLEQASPELVKFKNQYCNDPRANGQGPDSARKDANKTFKWDAIRFSHKVYAIAAAAEICKREWLVWMDADMVCHSKITVADLNRLCPKDRDLCFLGRKNKFSECGLYAMHINSPSTRLFIKKFQSMYNLAETGIFTSSEWHDGYVFDVVRKTSSLNELDWTGHIITGEGHPLINSEWGKYLDHLKGKRKQIGHSLAKDLINHRIESYWQSVS